MFKNTILLIIALFSFSIAKAQTNLNVSLVGQVQYTENANDIWGYTDAATGVEYAIIGLRNGTSVVSLADPANPVEVGYIPGSASTWRDIKTWGQYAYVTTDVGTDGLTVIDLTDLPNGVTSTNWQPTLTVNNQSGTLEKAHNIWIDENGFAYISGSNLGAQGVLILDVHTTPGTPIYLGETPNNYSHDCYTRGDTLYTADIYVGVFSVYDVSNKANPVLLGSHPTPFNFAHNVWLSDDSKTLFTTDEKANAPVASYDVSDVTNISELDQFRPLATVGQGVIPHNVHVWDDYLIVSYYTDGLILVDATRPDNMIEVGNFDTWLNSSGGFSGSWGAFPYLPSGLILVSDINNGLYVFQPNYVRACYLEGAVTDAATNNPINGATISITNTITTENSNVFGIYKTGIATAGTYTITASAPGYATESVSLSLVNGQVHLQDFQLTTLVPFTFSGQVINQAGTAVENAKVVIQNIDYTYELTTDVNGDFTTTMFNGNYEVLVGKWGFNTKLLNNASLSTTNNNLTIQLDEGYQDEFELDLGWTTTSTAQTGDWERAKPNGIFDATYGQVAPNEDVNDDFGVKCYVTGNSGISVADDDVDNGIVRLISPVFDASNYLEPYLSLATWFVNVGGSGTPDDALELEVSNGNTTVTIDNIDVSNPNWETQVYKLSDFITLSSTMRFYATTSDLQGSGHILEAGIDKFKITEGNPSATNSQNDLFTNIQIYPNPFNDILTFEYQLAKSQATLEVYNLVGQLVETQFIDNRKGKLQVGAALNTGIYFVRIIQDGQVSTTQKIVKVD